MKSILSYLMLVLFYFLTMTSVLADGGTISGTVKYANADSTIISYSKVILWDNANNRLDSMYADASANFSFSGLLPGTYHITAQPIHPWGGVNSADALLTLRHFTHVVTLNGVYLQVANVNGIQGVTSIDAYLIQRRFTQNISSFTINDWLSKNKVISIISNESYNITLFVICAGDVNGSYIPNNKGLPCPGNPSFTYGGQLYHTVQLGTQCWMKENLNIGTYVASTNTGNYHSNVSNNGIIEKYCYNNNPANCTIYGGLYDWNEMMQYTTIPGIQGICATGWHIPKDTEWDTLITYLGGYLVAGGKMKETGLTHWFAPNTGATNESGFTALAAGDRGFSGGFGFLYYNADFWSSSEITLDYTWGRELSSNNTTVYNLGVDKEYGYSVRCIKD